MTAFSAPISFFKLCTAGSNAVKSSFYVYQSLFTHLDYFLAHADATSPPHQENPANTTVNLLALAQLLLVWWVVWFLFCQVLM